MAQDVREIEITPEMIEAGIAALRQLEWEFWEQRTPAAKAKLVSAIYSSMASQDGDAHVG